MKPQDEIVQGLIAGSIAIGVAYLLDVLRCYIIDFINVPYDSTIAQGLFVVGMMLAFAGMCLSCVAAKRITHNLFTTEAQQ